jgi:hypothetical protein
MKRRGRASSRTEIAIIQAAIDEAFEDRGHPVDNLVSAALDNRRLYVAIGKPLKERCEAIIDQAVGPIELRPRRFWFDGSPMLHPHAAPLGKTRRERKKQMKTAARRNGQS